MITLDCSEHIYGRTKGVDVSKAELDEYEKKYAGVCTPIEGVSLSFDREKLLSILHIYKNAIDFITNVFERFIKDSKVDFEISVDETDAPTTPLQHYFIAKELMERGVRFKTIAPRFCGDFQKGIDYIGNVDQFKCELAVHAAIARHFGYKLSIHSGSDKFSVYQSIGELTKGCLHLKTAGTNWLEAMRLAAIKAPELYRKIHLFALESFNEAQKYYHVTADQNRVPDIRNLSDAELPLLFEQNDTRQLIHITYGLILSAKDEDGSFQFKEQLYALWNENADLYAELLENHIGRHLRQLSVKNR